MPKLSNARLSARIEVIKEAAAWIEDQAIGTSGSESFNTSIHDTELLEEEAIKLSKRLWKEAEKLALTLKPNK
ncbi:hypothetical protein N9R79_09840 [Vibrio sp.]|nr:hypothetical protein [Vibrio sp.]